MRRKIKVQPHPMYRTIGKWVRTRREACNLTQAELGRHLGLGPSGIASIEAGRQNVMVHQFVRLEEVLAHGEAGQ